MVMGGGKSVGSLSVGRWVDEGGGGGLRDGERVMGMCVCE
jgi:hypothetical protein